MKAPGDGLFWTAMAIVAASLPCGEAAAQAPLPSGGAPPAPVSSLRAVLPPVPSPSVSPLPPAVPPASPSAAASATPSAAPSVAELLARGAAASAAQKYEECAEAYGAAFALEPGGATAGELGICEERLARNVEAHDHLWYALAHEVPAAPAPVKAKWSRFHEAHVRVIKRVARVFLMVWPQTAEVLLDGVSLGTQVSGRFFAVLPGEHTWTVRVPGQPDVTRTIFARAGDLPDLGIAADDPAEVMPCAVAGGLRLPWRTCEALAVVARPPTPPCAAAGGLAMTAEVCAAFRLRLPPPQPERPEEPPCAAAGGVPMRVDVCKLFRLVSRRMDPTLGLVAGGLLSFGFTADVGPGFFLGGEAHWRRQEDWGFQVGADARFFLPTNAGSLLGRRLDLAVLELAVMPCARYKWAFGCAFVTPGFTLDSGPLTEVPEWGGPAPLFLFGVGPRLGVDIPVTDRFGVRAFADLRINPLEPSILYVNSTNYPVWEEPRVSGSVGLGISFR